MGVALSKSTLQLPTHLFESLITVLNTLHHTAPQNPRGGTTPISHGISTVCPENDDFFDKWVPFMDLLCCIGNCRGCRNRKTKRWLGLPAVEKLSSKMLAA